MSAGPIYDVVVRSDGDVLLLEIVGVGFTQARRQDEVEAMATDYIAEMTEEPVGSFGLNLIRA